MNIRTLLILLLGLLSYVVSESIATSLIFLILYLLGNIVLKLFNQDKYSLNVFAVTYGSYFIYALILLLYMQHHNYDYLQSYDGGNVYIPYTQELLEVNSLWELLNTIYNTSKYAFVGSILIPFVYVGKLSILLGGELYLPIQMIIMLFAAWTSVMVYNILTYKNIEYIKAYKYTLMYSLLSIHFIMSTYIVRDMPITLFFTILIYLSFKPFYLKNIFIMILLVLLTMSIRLSSGIFASLYVLLVLLMANKNKNEIKRVLSYALIISVMIIALLYFNEIQSTFIGKQESYLAKQLEADEGKSTIAAFNSLPFGISHFVKAFYNQIMPIPSWRTMIKTSFRPESYNIMNFPIIFATYFRYFIWITIIIGLFNKVLRRFIIKDKIVMYNFLIGVVFLLMQSTTMGHRRMMGVYPIFFLIAVMLYQNYNLQGKKTIMTLTFILFTSFQFIGAYYLI